MGRESFMESGQCLGDMPGLQITQGLCLPSVFEVADVINFSLTFQVSHKFYLDSKAWYLWDLET